ncbi:MAG TPA: polysaccharide deacetylase family protein [Stackebrandtia sp.]|uniref:polysaccharide deacetylase family protein n=1 Tax=Stackebrandtia sp. TaxID=2023065 RepID=UPI002D4E2DE5|nr:polysaccharide deacetylase family protein [Stackebrandtia sp.]HZE37196.1 polysaccharide deacetylase family protein [Stackebrandtia sp.]
MTSRRAKRLRVLGALSATALVPGALYWLCMSPYSQALGRFPYRGRTRQRVVALTFDDGPNEPYTSQIADYLDAQGIRATFFQVGKAVARHPDVTRRLLDGGHVIGHHGNAHDFPVYLRKSSLDTDMRQATAMFEAHGIRPALYRPPWLLRIPALFDLVRREGMRPVSGEFCHPLEVLQIAPGRIARTAVAKVRPGSIVIFHDGHDGHAGPRASTVAAVKIVVEALRDKGYRFTTVDKLLGVPAYRS